MKRRSFVQASMALGSFGALGSMVGCASVGRVPEKARVVVVGGGYGGATAAKYVRMLSDYKIDVTLIEPNGAFVSCPISNLVIGGSKTMADITTPYDKLSGKHGVNIVRDYVASVDPVKKTVTLASGPSIRLRSVRVTGAEGMADQAQWTELVQPLVGQMVSAGELLALADRIGTLLKARGWLLAQAYLPPQDVTGGDIEIRIMAGALDGGVDGMVHLSDLDWKRPGEQVIEEFKKGDMVRAQVLDVDVEKERISLGMKQLEKGAPAAGGVSASGAGSLRRGEVVTVTVLEVRDGGLEVQAGEDGATGFIKRTDLGRDRDEQRPDRFQVGQKLDAMVIGFDRSKKPNFSVKARQLAEEKEAVEQYGSSDAGASLGDILGAALKAKQ